MSSHITLNSGMSFENSGLIDMRKDINWEAEMINKITREGCSALGDHLPKSQINMTSKVRIYAQKDMKVDGVNSETWLAKFPNANSALDQLPHLIQYLVWVD